MWNFSLMFALLATCMTYLAVRRPKGVQPAAYGHIQTLSNLVDEWPEKPDMKLWWGYKSGTAEEDSEGSLFCAGKERPLCLRWLAELLLDRYEWDPSSFYTVWKSAQLTSWTRAVVDSIMR